MNCPKCGFQQSLQGAECQKCGLIFSKYLKMLEKKPHSTVHKTVATPKVSDRCEFILKEIGWIKHDHTLAHFAHTLGCFFMLLALVWAGYILYKQYRYKNTAD